MLKKAGLGFVIISTILYAVFLLLPLLLSGFLSSKSFEITKLVESNTGLKLTIDKIRLVTTPKLTVGVKFPHAELTLPNGDLIFNADNLHGELSLIPILFKKIEVDKVGAENLDISLKVKKDGSFLLEDFLPKEAASSNEQPVEQLGLPFGFKLSNKLPDIKIKNYTISFIDIPTDNFYSIYGDYFYISDLEYREIVF